MSGEPAATRCKDEMLHPWVLTSSDPTDEPLYLANGYMGIAVEPFGGVLGESSQCHIRGVYSPDGPAGVDHLATVPSPCGLAYVGQASLQRYERRLDLRTGILETRLDLHEERGDLTVEQRIAVSRTDPHRAIVLLTVRPRFDGRIDLRAALDIDTAPDLTVLDHAITETALHYASRVPRYDIMVIVDAEVRADGWSCDDRSTSGAPVLALSTELRAGDEATVAMITTITTSVDDGIAGCDAVEPAPPPDAMLAAHTAAWETLWATDIQVDGDPEVQQFARAALFYLWSTMQAGDRWSIAPMGLSSNVYNGHIFWDAELWMFPSLLVTHPELAFPCVAYREHTLPAAHARAAADGFRGARYPWEGAFTGEEMTPHWAATRDFQLHITADVAIGQWLYFLNTRDLAWLRAHGFPVMRACAEYWVSRVEHDAARDCYEISNVVCADEYAEHVNNDAFTNASVAHSLRVTARAAHLLGEAVPSAWLHIADRMYVAYDEERRIHIEYDGYDGQQTKQADVELLAYPLEYTTDDAQVARDLDFYGQVIDPNGPAMSLSIYAILSAQLGRTQAAYDFLRRSYAPNATGPFWAFSETPTNHAYLFCTGLGGALQALLFGFSGIRLYEKVLTLRPVLAPHWTSLRLRGLYLLGARTDLDVDCDGFTLCRATPPGELRLRVDESARTVRLLDAPPETHIVVEGSPVTESRTTPAGHDIPLPPDGSDLRLRILACGDPVLDLLIPARTVAPD